MAFICRVAPAPGDGLRLECHSCRASAWQIVPRDDGSVFAGERLEAFFAAGIRQAAAVKNEAAAVAAFVLWKAAVKRKAVDADGEIVRFRSEAEQLFRSEHALKRAHEGGKLDGQLHVVQEPAEILQSIRDALQEV